jgi:arabinofuranosyltransferase
LVNVCPYIAREYFQYFEFCSDNKYSPMKIQKITLVFSILSFMTLAYIYFPESIDDAYITLRYSKNLLLGNGPVFNIGERVEGYSNFSWMVLLAALGWVGVPMAMAMKVLGFASGVGVLALAWKISANIFKSGLAVGSPVVLLATSSFFAVWAVDGLETMFYTMLLTSLVYLLSTDRTNPLVIGIIASLVALTRPEGIMFSIIAVMYLTFKNGRVSGLKALVPVAIVAGGYELFRIYYFGEFVSNTAIAKVHWSIHKSLEGLRYLNAYNTESGYLMLPAALVGAAVSMGNPRLHIPILFILAQILFLMVSGADLMYAYRFVIPVLPCIALLCASGIEVAHKRVNRHFALIVLIVVAAGQAISSYASLPKKHIGSDNLTFRTSPLFAVADFLAPRSGKDDWILLSEAGIMPFYVDAKIRDYMGLVSPFSSVFNLNPLNGEFTINSDYLFSVRPKFIVLSYVETGDGRNYPRTWMDNDVLRSPEFASYHHVRNFDNPEGASFLNAIYYKYSPPNIRRVFFAVFERTDESGN